MAAETNKDQNVDESLDVSTTEKKDKVTVVKKKQGGVLSRIWNGVFRTHGDDFEKRLQHISKEEAAVLARMKKRSRSWRKMARNLIVFSVIFEVIAVGYAIMTTRSLDLNWKMRAFRILPMFLLPGLSTLTYSALASFTRMCDRKDQKTLERLRVERQEKIDELKEKTNYYSTQQLIQRYDTDPAAKAAAASILASKLGSDSGFNIYVGDESKLGSPTGKSNDVEVMQSSGLRNRKQLQTRSGIPGSTVFDHADEEMLHHEGNESPESSKNNQLVVEHHHDPGSTTHDGGWIARIAALLVGEDPTESYALICGNCHMHNGLARKEDFPYLTYYCPHCNALNRSKQLEESGSVSNPPIVALSPTTGDVNMVHSGGHSMNDETTSSSSETVAAAVETKEDKEG
ncbi:uncharacterized protein At2g24330-like [Cornus florida]|uniref:uncharacterized protein At2g24330-like n=1 Tax=Cornus florida TaxID=4283 RepID=UPI00289DAE72|nr:uncharacterized protein At2g24330-like [Cornus florida]XP_059665549.1 uncharacterized protein At2g24330-like [Cornus florida]